MTFNNNITSMKLNINHILSGFVLVGMFAIVSCGGKSALDEKKKELEKLKGEQTSLSQKIKTLEDEISKLDTALLITEKEKIVAVIDLAPATFNHCIDVQGSVDGDDNVTLSSKVPGIITRIHLKTGDPVRAGEVIAEMESDIIRTQIADVKTSWELANDLYNKQKSLWNQKIGTEMQYLQAKNNKESLEGKLATLKEQLEMYLIKSPVNGVIDENSLKIGQSVNPGFPYVRVVNYSNLKVKAEISESYSALIAQGNEVELFFPDINKTITSKVTYVSQGINPLTRTFTVEVALLSEKIYRPNMVVKLKIADYKQANSLVVPINTIQQLENENVIFVAERSGKRIVARKRIVKVGAMYNGKAEILEGLQAGDKLITTGYQDLNDNELIRF